ncbi:MAG: hypothetical protein KKH72_13355 [Alphaproteobacteria bacterium]|nr:hypothetical protein [Alphaproteobacteria bacterium]
MRIFLIPFLLILACAATEANAQVSSPYPSPAPMRDAEGHFIGPGAGAGETGGTETAVDEIVGAPDTMDETAPDEMSVEDNPAAQAAAAAALDAPPQPVTLSAKLVDDGPLIPSGLAWRVFSAEPSATGDIALVGRSDQATAVFELKPGDYLAQAAYGFAQATDTMTVAETPQARVLVLDAGALRLGARITGGQAIDESQLLFEIYPQGLEDDPRSVIVRGVRPGELVHLNAGVYHVVSKFGSVNAVAETDIRVDKGQLTDATMFHDAAQVSFRLVSELGGEAIADVDWTVRDAQGAIVYQFTGTFPSVVLAQGDYVVLANRGGGVHNRDFSVVPGSAHEIEVLTAL